MGVRRRVNTSYLVGGPNLRGQLRRVCDVGALLGIIGEELERELEQGEPVLIIDRLNSSVFSRCIGYMPEEEAWVVLVREGMLGWLFTYEMDDV